MTTITYQQFDYAVKFVNGRPDSHTRRHVRSMFMAAGIDIGPPPAPSAVVKLAREVSISFMKKEKYPEHLVVEAADGRLDDGFEVKLAVAVLKYAAKVVRESESIGNGGAICRAEILDKLGAK